MKKILSVILMIFLIFIGLCSTGVFKIKASNVVLKGQIFNLSNENTNMENIKINLFRKKLMILKNII